MKLLPLFLLSCVTGSAFGMKDKWDEQKKCYRFTLERKDITSSAIFTTLAENAPNEIEIFSKNFASAEGLLLVLSNVKFNEMKNKTEWDFTKAEKVQELSPAIVTKEAHDKAIGEYSVKYYASGKKVGTNEGFTAGKKHGFWKGVLIGGTVGTVIGAGLAGLYAWYKN